MVLIILWSDVADLIKPQKCVAVHTITKSYHKTQYHKNNQKHGDGGRQISSFDNFLTAILGLFYDVNYG